MKAAKGVPGPTSHQNASWVDYDHFFPLEPVNWDSQHGLEWGSVLENLVLLPF